MSDLEAWLVPIETVVAEAGAELIEAKWCGEAKRSPLQIIVDAPGGIDSDLCAKAASAVAAWLDEVLPQERSFSLDVMSPGPSRPLQSARDFRRILGRRLRVVSKDSGVAFEGTLSAVSDDGIRIDTDDGGQDLALAAIAKAKVVYDIDKADENRRESE